MGCPGWIRVTIGEAEEGDLFLAAMEELRKTRGQPGEPHPINGLRAESLSPES